jgi:hypothetical protein
MKKIIGSLALTLFVLRAAADVFIAPSNRVVFLTVPTNQTMLISSIDLGNFDNSGGTPNYPAHGLIILNGVTNDVVLSNAGHDPSPYAPVGPYAVNGPCQIAFVGTDPTMPAAAVVSYRLLQNSMLHSLIVSPGSTNVIPIPTAKKVRFLSPTLSGFTGTGFAILQNGTNAVLNAQINNGDEFTGPLTITIVGAEWTSYSQLISYYFTDDCFVVPDTGYIQGPTGSFEIAVEKSVDLTAWSPVVVYNTASDQKAFYRLRIQK